MDLTETLFLPYDSLIEYISSPLDRSETEQIFAYSSFAVKKMLKKRDKAYGKLKLSVFEGIFTGVSSVAELTRKRYENAAERQIKSLFSCVLIDEILNGKPVFFFPIEEKSEREDGQENYVLLPPVRLNVQFEGGGMARLYQKAVFTVIRCLAFLLPGSVKICFLRLERRR